MASGRVRGPVAGLDLGGTKILGVVVSPDEPGRPLLRRKWPTARGEDPVVDAVARGVAELDELAREATGGAGIEAVGLGAAGLVTRSGVLRVGPNLPGVRDVDLHRRLRARIGRPLVVDNDATCAMWAEHRLGAAQGCRDAVLVTLGTGIGGGLLFDGRLHRGAHGYAGEPGHMVVDPSGPRCVCGRRGCWERYASGAGLAWQARELVAAGRGRRLLELAGGDPEALVGEHVAQAFAEGDRDAAGILTWLAQWTALGVANLAWLLDPEVVVIGGGVSTIGVPLLEAVDAHFDDLLDDPGRSDRVVLRLAELGEEAGAIGAALLALEADPSHAPGQWLGA